MLGVLGSVHAQPRTGAQKMTEAEQQVSQAWMTFAGAMVDGDAKALDSLMDGKFTLTHITGYVQPRAEWLSQVRSGHFDYHRIDTKSVTVNVNGSWATLVSRAVVNVSIGGGRGNWNLQSTVNFEKRDGRWIALSYVARTY